MFILRFLWAVITSRFLWTLIGIALLCLAVAGDAITVNLQEKILRHLQCSKEQMMFASNIMASGWVFLLIAVSGQLMKALPPLYSLPEIAGISCARALVLT